MAFGLVYTSHLEEKYSRLGGRNISKCQIMTILASQDHTVITTQFYHCSVNTQSRRQY